jgi:hypothetical protein
MRIGAQSWEEKGLQRILERKSVEKGTKYTIEDPPDP